MCLNNNVIRLIRVGWRSSHTDESLELWIKSPDLNRLSHWFTNQGVFRKIL